MPVISRTNDLPAIRPIVSGRAIARNWLRSGLVDDAWIGQTGSTSEGEESMLDMNPDRQDNSRLSCQIKVTDDLEGLVVQLPEFQY
jgi:hypothetical protein